MPYIDKTLLQAAKSAGNKISLEVGDSFQGTYLGFETVKDEKFNKIRYRFKFKLSSGEVKFLQSNASKFLRAMAYVSPNTVLSVVRTGESTNTNYEVTVIKEPKQPAQVEMMDEPAEPEEVIQLEDEEDEDEEDPLEAQF